MRSNSMLTATMALLALISASVTASPIMNIIDRISGEFGEESNNVLSTMRDIDITDRNMDDWWKQYDVQIKEFKDSLGGKNITKENDAANELVCTTHKKMMETLNKVKTQWGKVWSAWEAKNQLLNLIWGILNDDTKENKNESGLHCKADGQAGAAKQLCTLLRNLMATSKVEEQKLKDEKATIEKYIKNVTEYKCDCTFADWDGDFGECAGGTVKQVNIFKQCENAETMKESVGKVTCKPTKSSCGEGKHSKTRTRRWDAKDGGEGKKGKICKVGEHAEGEFSAVDNNEKQTLTADCKAGEHKGECPVDCQWGEWSNGGNIETAACPAQSCSDKDKKQTIIRKKIKERKFGGKFCFKDEKGHYSTHETPCSFETTATLAQNKLTHDKDKYENLVKVLKAEMCKDVKGPCGENGNCKVEINDDGKLTSWCKCNEGYKGKWCEQAPEKKDEKKTKWVKTDYNPAKVFITGCPRKGSTSRNISAETTCQANCLRLGGNAINYSKRLAMCECRSCNGTPPTPSHKAANGFVGYYVE